MNAWKSECIKGGVMKTRRQLLWLCFELLSWSSNWLPSSGNGVPLIYIHMGGLIGVICKEGVLSSGCLLDHPLPLGWLLLHRSGRLGRLQLTSLPTVTLSFQANWQMCIGFSQCTFSVALGLTKTCTTVLWLNFYSFPNLREKKLSYITCRRSGQASDTHPFRTRRVWVYKLWQVVPLLPWRSWFTISCQ